MPPSCQKRTPNTIIFPSLCISEIFVLQDHQVEKCIQSIQAPGHQHKTLQPEGGQQPQATSSRGKSATTCHLTQREVSNHKPLHPEGSLQLDATSPRGESATTCYFIQREVISHKPLHPEGSLQPQAASAT